MASSWDQLFTDAPSPGGRPGSPVGLPASPVGGRALAVAVVGGCGGAGASTVAVSLARAAAEVTRSLLVDCDRLGPGVDRLLGAQDEPGARWPELALARGQLLPGSLTSVLPLIDGIRVLTWSSDPTEVPAEAVAAVVGAAVVEAGLVVLDLPRSPTPASVEAGRRADVALLVVPADARAAASAVRGLADLRECCAEVKLVVRLHGGADLPPGLVAEALGLPLAGVVRPEPGLREALDRGEPPGLRRRSPLARFSRELLRDLRPAGQ